MAVPNSSSSSNQPPGPDADAAFALGLKASVVLIVLIVVCSFQGGFLALFEAAALLVFGVPVAVVIASCTLAVWLGYSPDTAAAVRQTRAARKQQGR